MQNQTNLDKLNDKVTQILQNYNTYKEENKTFRTEIVTLKAEFASGILTFKWVISPLTRGVKPKPNS